MSISLALVCYQMTSVERILEYSSLTPEAPLQTSGEFQLPVDWPTEGSVMLDNASFRYSQDGQVVLSNICAKIRPKEKVLILFKLDVV